MLALMTRMCRSWARSGTPPDRRLARCRGQRRCAWIWMLNERRRHVAGAFLVPALSGLDLAEPVMYLSWTGDLLVVDPP